jgi:osmoprotectant transport system ATP-binding protein
MSMSGASPTAVVEFAHVHYSLPGDRTLLVDVTLAVHEGEVLVLLGRSGAGKTTALRLVNRLLDPTQGEVRVEGTSTIAWSPIRLRRRIGYAIQEGGLFPHFTVERNIGLVPTLERWEPSRIEQRTTELLDLVGLSPGQFAKRYPHELSGGQRQRVGLARALAADPPILLLDEPFGALDPLTRTEMQQEFRRLQRGLRKSVVFVTHDVREALLLGDRIAVLSGGKLAGVYTASTFLHSEDPVTAQFVRAFRAGEEVFGP